MAMIAADKASYLMAKIRNTLRCPRRQWMSSAKVRQQPKMVMMAADEESYLMAKIGNTSS